MSSTDKEAPKHTGTDEEHEGWRAKTYAWAVGEKLDKQLFGPVDERKYPSQSTGLEKRSSAIESAVTSMYVEQAVE